MIRVMLVEDHVLMSHALTAIVNAQDDMAIVAEAADGTSAIQTAMMVEPDVILMDIDLPDLSGIEVTREIARWLSNTRVVMMTVSSAEEDLFSALRAGAVGYITKDSRRGEIADAIRMAREGTMALTPRMANLVLSHFRSLPPSTNLRDMANLSPREKEILMLLSQGLRDKDIASQLAISPATVRKHVEHLLEKLHARTRAEATAWLRADGKY